MKKAQVQEEVSGSGSRTSGRESLESFYAPGWEGGKTTD